MLYESVDLKSKQRIRCSRNVTILTMTRFASVTVILAHGWVPLLNVNLYPKKITRRTYHQDTKNIMLSKMARDNNSENKQENVSSGCDMRISYTNASSYTANKSNDVMNLTSIVDPVSLSSPAELTDRFKYKVNAFCKNSFSYILYNNTVFLQDVLFEIRTSSVEENVLQIK